MKMNPNSVIRLNVGGKKYVSSKETLSKSELISAYLNRWNDTSDSMIYFDSDGRVFEYVLGFMRNDIEFQDIPTHLIRRFLRSIDYFQVEVANIPKFINVDVKEEQYGYN